MKRVLIISFYFPPYADIAGVRSLKYCKFLPEYGWAPWVLTVDSRYYGKKSNTPPPKEIQTIKLSRLPYLPIPAARTFASLLYPLLIFFFVLRNRKQIDAICMIGSPFHPFILTPILSKIFNIPTSLDFRDSWSYNFGFDGKHDNEVGVFEKAKKRLFFAIEKISLKYSSFATFATSVLRDEYAHLTPQHSSKYHVIYNGYDQDDFVEIQPAIITKGTTIILTGKFHIYTPKAVRIFIEVIQEIGNITFIYVGNECDIIRSIAREVDGIQNIITISHQPYDYVLQLIAGSDYCLLSNGLINGMGTKIFDYLALSKPTLCLVPQGSIITQQFGDTPGVVISEAPHCKKSVKSSLEKLLTQNSASINIIDKKYSRREGAQKLATLFNRFV